MEYQLVSFKLEDEEYAVDILSVHEIIRIAEITKLPNSPAYVEGVINLRGKVIPVMDLRKKFGLQYIDTDENLKRIIITDANGIMIGMIVDSVSEVLRINADTVEPPPPIAKGMNSEYIKGVGKLNDRLLILLDWNKIIKDEELAVCV